METDGKREINMEIKCINLGYVVADEKAEHVEKIFKKHAEWMSGF